MAEMVGLFFHAEIFADAVVEMDDEIAGRELMEIGGGRVVGAAPFLPADVYTGG